MNSSLLVRSTLVALMTGLVCLTGCPAPKEDGGSANNDVADAVTEGAPEKTDTAAPEPPARVATAAAEDVQAATTLLDKLSGNATYTLVPDGVLTAISIKDGSNLAAENIALFSRLTDLETLHILNFRDLNDGLVAQLAGLKNLTSLALTNSIIGDETVELIVDSFPNLTYLDLSSNTNLSSDVIKTLSKLENLERLMLVQNRINDLGTRRLSRFENLRLLDLRGNMEVGDSTMETIAELPKIAALKHRSTTVTDAGMEHLAESQTLKALLMQDFGVTGQAGQHLAKLPNLSELEIFRCQGFTSDGVLALKGLKLTRLTLRDLPMVDDQAMAVFTDLPVLKKLYLHELGSLSDTGLENLKSLQSLELLDIWTVPEMSDATVDVIATLPNLKELSIRTTSVTDAAVDKILAMPKLESLTLKDNASVTAEGIKKLSGKKWKKLDTGN